ncbi:peroxisomal membrane anchor protein conserved region-domain-containing protein [Elsinoe ampelina]|uniref:Peroxisomal membrane protein PEX14 n=1 Tax=Elsinoe ampelina TaxID=302913 RepID=A0A6A6FYY9_9PEZI|nr:peroxisomal membrane anchor protein conserved region-domain-containing protein [Elsinoe ampelina]
MPGDPKARSIPSWQQQPLKDEAKKEASSTEPATPQEPEMQTVHESVKRFLDDPSVRDAPEDKKRSFLASKGVDQKTVDAILRQQSRADMVERQVEFDVKDFASRSSQPPPPAPVRESPPIVTYPEFLVKPQKPPPLVTISRLLTTAYIAGGLATTFYGLSKYIIEPMAANLTEARHEFADHSTEKIQSLNEKLERVVSKVPAPKSTISPIDHISDLESITSDPTELFHRDIGVQTSPSLSRRPSTDSSLPDPATRTLAEKQEERLRIIRSHLDEILDGEVSGREGNGSLETSVGDLRDYLNGLFFAPQRHVEYGVWQSKDPEDKKDDAVAAFRNEIRGVKGMLLSARRFPAGKPTTKVGA